MTGKQGGQQRAIAYLVALEPGLHTYAFIEGLGECREPFMRLVEQMERGECEVVVAMNASFFWIENAPAWMERFIRAAQQRGILVVDATDGGQYDLRNPADEAAFREVGKGV